MALCLCIETRVPPLWDRRLVFTVFRNPNSKFVYATSDSRTTLEMLRGRVLCFVEEEDEKDWFSVTVEENHDGSLPGETFFHTSTENYYPGAGRAFLLDDVFQMSAINFRKIVMEDSSLSWDEENDEEKNNN
jgi:hypothetical protein